MHLKNLRNPYQSALGALFADMPKAVLAAVAVSALTTGGDYLEEAAERVALEWERLHAAGVVPQKPSKLGLELAAVQRAREAGEPATSSEAGGSGR